MAQRLDLGPLFEGLIGGLRHRSATGEERADLFTRAILFGGPVAVLVLTAVFQIRLPGPDQLLAGVGLLTGALLTGFAQIASWRERLLDARGAKESVRVRALNEAAAHILVSVVGSVAVTALTVTLTFFEKKRPPLAEAIAAQAISSVALALLTYVAISLIIVVNLLWDAFQEVQQESKRTGLAEFQSGGDSDGPETPADR